MTRRKWQGKKWFRVGVGEWGLQRGTMQEQAVKDWDKEWSLYHERMNQIFEYECATIEKQQPTNQCQFPQPIKRQNML